MIRPSAALPRCLRSLEGAHMYVWAGSFGAWRGDTQGGVQRSAWTPPLQGETRHRCVPAAFAGAQRASVVGATSPAQACPRRGKRERGRSNSLLPQAISEGHLWSQQRPPKVTERIPAELEIVLTNGGESSSALFWPYAESRGKPDQGSGADESVRPTSLAERPHFGADMRFGVVP